MKSISNIRVMYTLLENLCIHYNSTENKKRAMSDLEDWNDFYDVVMPENRNTQRVDFHACKPILLHLST